MKREDCYKRIVCVAAIFAFACFTQLHALDDGFTWALRANFNGTATLPSISAEDMDKLGASFMKGGVGYTMDGEAELGYNFGGERFFKMSSNKIFGGMSLFGSIGIGNGYTGEIAGGTYGSVTATMYININYAPVITLGVGTKAFMLQDRLALGLWLGTKMIADLSPEYMAYMDDSTIMKPEIGEVIVTPFMIKNMNPFSFSMKTFVEYHQPINNRVSALLTGFLRFNVWKPKYITMPDSLLTLIHSVRPDFSVETPLPSFYLNSLDFGVSLGVQFKA
ncbi:MAG: hypothetical protein IJR50_06435 [Treponema sp.]|nr:hypothetical protein [Treponema sp.]